MTQQLIRLSIVLSALMTAQVLAFTKEDCVANGGNKLCLRPAVTSWNYSAFDRLTDFSYVMRARCEAQQGTWEGQYGAGCVNYSELTDAGLAGYAETLFNILGDTESCQAIDSGWGQSWQGLYNSTNSPTYVSGVLLADYKVINVTGCGTVYGSRSRDYKCLPGTDGVTLNGEYFCVQEQQFNQCEAVGNPVMPFTGRKVQAETDISSNATPFIRHYNSSPWLIPIEAVNPFPVSSAYSASIGQFGDHWRTDFDYRLYALSSSVASIAISFPSGELHYFDAELRPVIGSSKPMVLSEESGYYWLSLGGKRMKFSPDGYLTELRSPGSQSLHFRYSAEGSVDAESGAPVLAGLLTSVQKDDGSTLYKMSYDVAGRITSVTSGPHQATYAYDTAGNLTSATYPGGAQRRYSYALKNGVYLLTRIADETGSVVAAWQYDDLGRAFVSEHAAGVDRTVIDYAYLNATADPHVTVTGALGKQSVYYYEVAKGIRRLKRIEGLPSEHCAAASKHYEYFENGSVKSKTDWSGNITTYVRDGFGREVSRTEAAGTPEAKTIQTEYHPGLNLPVRVTEPSRVTTYTYDAEGRLQSRSTQSGDRL